MSFINAIKACCPCCFSAPVEPRNQADILIQAVTNTTQTPETGPPNAPEGNPPQGSPKQKRPPVVVNQLNDQQHLYPQTNPGSTEPEEEEEQKMDEAGALLPNPAPSPDDIEANQLGFTLKELQDARKNTAKALEDIESRGSPLNPETDLHPLAKELGLTKQEWEDSQNADSQAREELDQFPTFRPAPPSYSSYGAPVPSAPPPPEEPQPYFDANGDELCISHVQPFNPNHKNK